MKNDNLITKNDLEKFGNQLGKKIEKTLDKKLEIKFDVLKSEVKNEIRDQIEYQVGYQVKKQIDESLGKWKSELFDLVDGLAIEIRDGREHRIVTSHQIVEHRERIDNLEKKVFGKQMIN